MRVYLDHNASSPIRPEACAALNAALAAGGNASSPHREGQQARARVEAAFSWPRVAEATVGAYREVLAERRRVRG